MDFFTREQYKNENVSTIWCWQCATILEDYEKRDSKTGVLLEILKKFSARNFIKNETHTQMNFGKLLRTLILENLCEELLLMRWSLVCRVCGTSNWFYTPKVFASILLNVNDNCSKDIFWIPFVKTKVIWQLKCYSFKRVCFTCTGPHWTKLL